MTDERFGQCMAAMTNGDRNGLKEIYEEYMPYVYRVVYGVVGSREDAEDISTDVFLKLWDNAAAFRQGSPHKAYIATVSRNLAIDFLRKHNRIVLGSEDETVEDMAGAGSDPPPDTADTVVGNISVAEALNSLNEAERMVVSMKVLSDMTFKEIAEQTGIPMGTVTWRYREAMKRLRRYGFDEGSE